MADGASEAEDMVGVKFEIVGNEIVMGLGADKECSPEVIADSDSSMNEEMGAVNVSAATRNEAAICGVVEQDRLSANPCHEVGSGFSRHMIGIDDIRVIQDRAIVLVSVVQTFVCAECAFNIESPAPVAEVLQAGTGEDSSRFCRRNIGLGRGLGFGRPQSAAAQAEIDLLGGRKTRQRAER